MDYPTRRGSLARRGRYETVGPPPRRNIKGDPAIPPLAAPPVSLLQGASLFLDFDGTLVEIAPTPDGVVVAPALPALLARLDAALDGRLAILSGRSVAQIEALLGGTLAIGGSHGTELRWRDGRIDAPAPTPALRTVAAEFRALRARRPGVLVEEKPHGIGLHFRQAPDAEDECREIAHALAAANGLVIQPGKMLFELRAPGADKGRALAAFMAEPPMRGGRPIFLGDDATDEAGFASAAALGGTGVLVGEHRSTAAGYRLDDVSGVLRWLEDAVEALA